MVPSQKSSSPLNTAPYGPSVASGLEAYTMMIHHQLATFHELPRQKRTSHVTVLTALTRLPAPRDRSEQVFRTMRTK